MPEHVPGAGEAQRLEELWAGSFGLDYIDRNRDAGTDRARYWSGILSLTKPRTVLEIGCNVGGNLQHFESPETDLVCGVDINYAALGEMTRRLPEVRGLAATARALPFRTHSFDLVFTAGVLIHIPDDSLQPTIDEMLRCSRRFILCAEYHSEDPVEIPYRGELGALFKRDYRDLFLTTDPDLSVVDEGVLGPERGFDYVTYHLFSRA